VLHATLIVILIGLGDSLNPATLGPAMYLATLEHPRRALAQFLIGFVAVNLVGGLLILLGPGELILSLVPKPRPVTKHILEVVAGVALIAISIGLWSGRRTLGRRKPPTFQSGGRSGVKLGAGIALIELPSALPYFAAIAVIIGSGAAIPGKILMLVLYNVAFVLPVIAILVALIVARDGTKEPLAKVNDWIVKRWPVALAALAGLLGTAILVVGVVGLLEL
jgi:cytochrome c biogenesis protein CcdA